MSRCDDFIYDSQPVYDEYKDEDWYHWFGSDGCPYGEKIDEEDYTPTRKIPKNPFMFAQVCAVSEKQAARIRSPLDLSDFWICDPRLINTRSDRWDFRLVFFERSYDFLKLLRLLNLVLGVQENITRVVKSFDRVAKLTVASIVNGGLLTCTATDMEILCVCCSKYDKEILCVSYSNYGSHPLREKYCSFMTWWIVITCIDCHTNRCKWWYVVPILIVEKDFYVHVFARVYNLASSMKNTPLKPSYVYQCVGCDSLHLQPIGRTLSKNTSVRNLLVFEFVVPRECRDCGKKRADILFDPGGFDLGSCSQACENSWTSFFKRGRMMLVKFLMI